MARWKMEGGRWKMEDGGDGRGAYRERLHHVEHPLQRSALSPNCAVINVICCRSLGHQPRIAMSGSEAFLVQPIIDATFVAYSLTHGISAFRHVAHGPAKMRKAGPASICNFNCRNVRRPTAECLSVRTLPDHPQNCFCLC